MLIDGKLIDVLGAKLLGVFFDEKPPEHKGEYCAYEIRIATDKGTLRIFGCHDSGPEIKFMPPASPSPIM